MLTAALCAASAVLLGWAPAPAPGPRLIAEPAPVGSRVKLGRVAMVLALIVFPVVGALLGGDAGLVVGICLSLLGDLGGWLLARGRWRARVRAGEAAAVRGCEELAARLRIGLMPSAALAAVAVGCPPLAEPAAALAVGGDVPATLRRCSRRPGEAALGDLAIAWEVSVRTGASMTDALDALAERLVAEHEVARVVAAELAAPRATGRLLAALPLLGLGLGYLFGGDPVAYLLGSLPGRICLVLGTGLAVAGVIWNERLTQQAGG